MQHDSVQEATPAPIAADDARVEDAVLALVLAEHPTQLTVSELTRELCGGSSDFAGQDAVESAVRDLVGSGLLHYHGDFVVPTRAALRFDRMGSAGR